MKILLANPRGFCAGVDRAIDIVERALELFGAPIYVRHEVVHNRFVVDRLRSRGAVFVDELDEVPPDATVIFSAHGVSKAVQAEARRRGLRVFDATCPLVTKVHMEVVRYAREGRDVILIGHEGHPEVEGTNHLGEIVQRHVCARLGIVQPAICILLDNDGLTFVGLVLGLVQHFGYRALSQRCSLSPATRGDTRNRHEAIRARMGSCAPRNRSTRLRGVKAVLARFWAVPSPSCRNCRRGGAALSCPRPAQTDQEYSGSP